MCIRDRGRDKLFIGELGLTGETRNVSNIKERITAAGKYNFKKIYVSAGSEITENTQKPKLEIFNIHNIEQLSELLKKEVIS